jgi:hypothetical protein
MVKRVADHYADHLGPIYTWIAGDIDAAPRLQGERVTEADI